MSASEDGKAETSVLEERANKSFASWAGKMIRHGHWIPSNGKHYVPTREASIELRVNKNPKTVYTQFKEARAWAHANLNPIWNKIVPKGLPSIESGTQDLPFGIHNLAVVKMIAL